MIRDDLREEITLKLDKIRGNPEAYDSQTRLVRDDLRILGDVYSFWIENPDLRKSLLNNKEPNTIMKIARKGTRNIHNAWRFLTSYGQDSDFAEVFEGVILQGANALVNGRRFKEGEYRYRDVTLGFRNYMPPNARDVPNKVQEAIEKIRGEYKADSLGAAIYAHLAFALIQPFDEGNKRTARLVQDRILVDAGMPPAIIPAGEGKFYFMLLEKVASAYKDGDANRQSIFYNYMASKVNNGLDKILNDLNLNWTLPLNSNE